MPILPTAHGTTYELIEVDDQCWFAENLKTSVYANDFPISNVTNEVTWANTSSGAWTFYFDNNSINDFSYNVGPLNWHAVSNAHGICPPDYHVPTDQEWTDLTQAFGGESVAGGKLKNATLWNGTDESGFNALPGGERGVDGSFASGGIANGNAYFWTSTANGSNAWLRVIGGGNNGIGRYGDGHPNKGFSVRCVED